MPPWTISPQQAQLTAGRTAKNFGCAATDSTDLGKKIREAELDKVPYMLIVGESEASGGTVSVRKQGEGDLGSVTIEAFAERIQREVSEMLANNI